MDIENLINKINNKRKIVLIIAIIAIIAIVIYILIINQSQEDFFSENIEMGIEENQFENSINQIDENIQKEENIQKIIVHVAGQVVNNGIVELEEGQRVVDAIEKAGGVTAEADLSKINLAYVLTDGQKVYIPKINENYIGEYVTDTSGTIEIDNKNTSTSKEVNKIVNINTASVEELQNLQGIGESIAKRIVEYRKQNGKFNSIEDIKNVSGIGESKFNKIKQYICIK